jgi:hypothetical protein
MSQSTLWLHASADYVSQRTLGTAALENLSQSTPTRPVDQSQRIILWYHGTRATLWHQWIIAQARA